MTARVPVMRPPVVVCAQRVAIAGRFVECVRRAGHPVAINYAHTDGVVEWCFDERGAE